MFNNYKSTNKLLIVKFINVLNYAKHLSIENKLELINETTLDISYGPEINLSHRITISGIDNINNILNLIHQRKNHIAYSILVTQFSKNENFSFMTKQKNAKDIVDIDNYDLRFRLSEETPFDKNVFTELSNLQQSETDKIIYRYKQRLSLYLSKNFRLDLTIIKMASSPDDLANSQKNYEIELEYIPEKEKEKIKVELLLKDINKYVTIIKQVLENSDEIISKEESITVIKKYKKLVFGNEENIFTNLYSMNPISSEVQHVVDKIPNKYCVSDKADGNKYHLLVLDGIIYLITNNLVVKKTSYKVKNLESTILEGELLHIKNAYLFVIYDCLFFKEEDIRIQSDFSKRLKYIHEFEKIMGIKSYIIKPFEEKFNIIKQKEHYQKEASNFYNNLSKLLKESKVNDIIFHSKLFIFPIGGDNSEVFSFADIIWSGCTNQIFKCPYLLDGIIFTGIDQKYTKDKRDQKYPIYKYKPPSHNSLDVYVEFQRNLKTGSYLEIYDNSIDEQLKSVLSTQEILADEEKDVNISKVFRVANFYVGDNIGNKEVPVLFMKEENNHEAFFLLDKDQVRDVEGNLVNDKTVIEIIYTNDISIPHQYRWQILRTRWDKTESVMRNNKQYGNYKDSAIDIWKSMKEAVTIEEIKKLADPTTYQQQKNLLASRINTKIVSSERAHDVYYQKVSNLGKIFREYNNWIKSNIVYMYCSPNQGKRKSVLDIGCGRGGDIHKFYTARVGDYVGIDPSYDNLFGIMDGAVARYKDISSKYPDFTKMTWIESDGGLPLTVEAQEKRFPNMTNDNKKLIDKIFTKDRKFDVLSFMFCIHYMFDSIESVNYLIETIKTYLKDDGYLFITTFDANYVMKLLNGKMSYTSYYTDDNGQKNKFFEIVKKFDNQLEDKPGQAIDVFQAWINQEGHYFTEYCVTPKLLINTMKKAGLKLVDSVSFKNIYNINKSWFSEVIDYEENPKNKQFYKKVSEFYGDLKDADKESFIYDMLNKMYVFKKI